MVKEKVEKTQKRALFDKSSDGIVITSLKYSKVLDANPAYQAMLGYSLAELKDLTYLQFTPAKWLESEAKIIAEMLETGYGIEEKEYIRKDGTVFPVALRGYIIRDDAGNPEKICAFATDISERKKAEQAVLKELEERERAERINE